VSRPQRSLDFFVEHSLVLPLGALIALAWANLSYAGYTRVAHALEFPINDVGMVFFFALATKEVVEATAPGGALHTWRRAALPGVAAVGGMVAPAIIYMVFIRAAAAPELGRGWAIPCATDIAFSFLVAKAIFRRHAAIPFLLLLAIADDALGLVILALFYGVAVGSIVNGYETVTAIIDEHVLGMVGALGLFLTAFPGTEPGPYLGSPSSSALYAHVEEILATQRRVAPHKWRAITTGEGLAGVTVPDPASMRLPPMPNGIATAG